MRLVLLGNPILAKRQNLIDRLEHQRRLAKDPNYVVVTKATTKGADGTKVLIERTKRIRPWWKTDEKGAVVLTVQMGFKVIEFEKGKSGIAVGSMDKIDGILATLVSAVRAGELDQHIEKAKVARRAPAGAK